MTKSKNYLKEKKEIDVTKLFGNIVNCIHKIDKKEQQEIGKIFRNNLKCFPDVEEYTIPTYLKKNNQLAIRVSPPLKKISKVQKGMIFIFLASLCYYFFNDTYAERRCNFIYNDKVKDATEIYERYISSYMATEPLREHLEKKKIEFEEKKKTREKSLLLYEPKELTITNVVEKFSFPDFMLPDSLKKKERMIKLYKNDMELMEMGRLIQSTEKTLKNAGVDDKKIFKRNAQKMKMRLQNDIELYEKERKNCISENKLNELFFYGMSSVIIISQIFDRSLIQFILGFAPFSAELNHHKVDMMLACFLNTVYMKEVVYGKMVNLITEGVFSKLAEKARKGTLDEIFNIPNTIYTVLATLIGGTILYVYISKKLKSLGKEKTPKSENSKNKTPKIKTPSKITSTMKRKTNKSMRARTPRGKDKFEKLMKSFKDM
jgi:hypothetical protein